MGLKSFAILLENISCLPFSRQKHELKRNLHRWKGENAQVDDIIVVGLHLLDAEKS